MFEEAMFEAVFEEEMSDHLDDSHSRCRGMTPRKNTEGDYMLSVIVIFLDNIYVLLLFLYPSSVNGCL